MLPAFAETATGGRLFYWNLDASVGLGGVNHSDDVMFVQWCLFKAAQWDGVDRASKNIIVPNGTTVNITPGSLKESFSKTNVSGICTGKKDDNLVEKITMLQALVSVDMDGRVDPIIGSAKHMTSIGIKDVYLIMRLNQVIKEVHPKEYPRLDLMPQFIWRVSNKVKPVFWES